MDWIINNLAAVIGIVAISITLIRLYWNYWKDRKRLSFQIITDNQLIDKTLSAHNIKISHNGKEVNDFRLFIVRFVNDGYKTIQRNEFDDDISVFFGSKAEILLAELTNKVPNNLQVDFDESGKALKVKPIMLNRGDHFTIKLLVSNSNRLVVKPEVRISGIKDFTLYKESSLLKLIDNIGLWLALGGFGCSAIGLVGGIKNKLSSAPPTTIADYNPLLILAVGLIGLAISYMFVRLHRYLKKNSY